MCCSNTRSLVKRWRWRWRRCGTSGPARPTTWFLPAAACWPMLSIPGSIGRLALPVGQKGQLTLRPAGGVRIGRNAAGSEVTSDIAAISGSALGVIIDARGRPLRLPDDPLARQQLLWDWLVSLGVESGPLPYAAAEPQLE